METRKAASPSRAALIHGAPAMRVVAAALATTYALSTLPTPLYVLYQDAFHFSQIMLTLVYAAYVVGTTAAMFFLGRLSDQIGRRPVLLASLGIGAGGALLFVFAASTIWLFPARILSGLAIALASGAATAWIIELHPRQDKAAGTQLAIAANLAGLGLGALLAGLLAQYGPWPLRLSYLAFLALLAPILLLVTTTEPTVRDAKPLGEASLRPRLGVPKGMRGAFIGPALAAVAVFSVLGFYSALTPSLLRDALRNPNHAAAGAIVGELFFVGVFTIAVTRRLSSHRGSLLSLGLLLPSVALLFVCEVLRSLPILLMGTAIAGAATGLGYRCGLQLGTNHE
jgi:MFS family permease